MPAADDRRLLEDAARAAGAVARRWFGADPRVWQKGDAGPVTEADLEIDALLRARLTAARPDYGWLSEESTDDPARLARRRVFVVDPIDGTRAFVAGQPDFTHALAVVEDGAPVAAAILQPMRDRLWSAHRGGGAARDGVPVAPTAARLPGASVLAAKPALRPEAWPGGPPEVTRTFRSSLAYRMALVAEGRFDAMLTLRPCWEWDIAAGALICLEAGAAVTDRRGGPLRFNNATPQVDGVVAAGRGLHAELVDRLLPGAA